MVEKISINIKVLSLNVEHNFLVPFEMSVNTAIILMVQLLQEEYRGVHYLPRGNYCLVQVVSGKALPGDCSFRQLDMAQGETLLLM